MLPKGASLDQRFSYHPVDRLPVPLGCQAWGRSTVSCSESHVERHFVSSSGQVGEANDELAEELEL